MSPKGTISSFLSVQCSSLLYYLPATYYMPSACLPDFIYPLDKYQLSTEYLLSARPKLGAILITQIKCNRSAMPGGKKRR
jgi:hypothetical protein